MCLFQILICTYWMQISLYLTFFFDLSFQIFDLLNICVLIGHECLLCHQQHIIHTTAISVMVVRCLTTIPPPDVKQQKRHSNSPIGWLTVSQTKSIIPVWKAQWKKNSTHLSFNNDTWSQRTYISDQEHRHVQPLSLNTPQQLEKYVQVLLTCIRTAVIKLCMLSKSSGITYHAHVWVCYINIVNIHDYPIFITTHLSQSINIVHQGSWDVSHVSIVCHMMSFNPMSHN